MVEVRRELAVELRNRDDIASAIPMEAKADAYESACRELERVMAGEVVPAQPANKARAVAAAPSAAGPAWGQPQAAAPAAAPSWGAQSTAAPQAAATSSSAKPASGPAWLSP